MEFTERDPKDKGNRKVKYRDYGFDKENMQQDWVYLMTELKAAMTSGEKAEAFRRRLRKGMEWDKKRQDLEIEGGKMMSYASRASI